MWFLPKWSQPSGSTKGRAPAIPANMPTLSVNIYDVLAGEVEGEDEQEPDLPLLDETPPSQPTASEPVLSAEERGALA
eukprot:3101695-Rhodomonas_salina.1